MALAAAQVERISFFMLFMFDFVVCCLLSPLPKAALVKCYGISCKVLGLFNSYDSEACGG